MKVKSLIPILSLMLIFTISFNACEKEDKQIVDMQLVEDDALSSVLFDDVFTEVETAMEIMEYTLFDDGLKSANEIICKTITIEHPDDTTFWPRTVTIDYGEGCTGPDERVRTGKIIIVVNKWYKDVDYYRTVSFDNFHVDSFKIEGEKTVSFEGLNDNGNMHFAVTLSNGKVTSPEGNEMTHEYDRIREWVAGADTPRLRFDDEYMITGTASGINRNQIAYTRLIVLPLHKTVNCRWIRSGSVEIEAEGRELAVLDYGDGECDRIATVTVGDEVREITLHR